MCSAVRRFILTAAALVVFASQAGAQDAEFPPEPIPGSTCASFASYWATVADIARQRGCLPPADDTTGNDVWSSDVNEQLKLCDKNYDYVLNTIPVRNNEIRRVTAGNCGACAAAVDLQVYYAAGNQLYQCKYSSNDDRWNTDRREDINICLGKFNGSDVPAINRQYVTMIAEMRAQMDECKRTHKPQGCLFAGCHSSNSTAGVISMPKSSNALRDSLEQLPRRPKLNTTDIVVDPCKPGVRGATFPCKQPAAKVIDPGMLEGGNDLSRQGPGATGNPGGGAGAPAASPLYNRSR
jgi:hypothetical protein